MRYVDKLEKAAKRNNSLLCVGLDSDYHKLPRFFLDHRYPQFAFNRAIIDATHDLVCAYKPNAAFYEARGEEGIKELKMTCDYLRTRYPKLVIILDGKRADIGSTNAGYVSFVFDYVGADAVTLHPYVGGEALQPFLRYKDKMCYILCRTSNPGAGELQDLKVAGKPLYQVIAKRVATAWNKNRNCGLVVGATYPRELKIVRRIAKDLPFLIPGVGVQGGDLRKSIQYAKDRRGFGFVITSSRTIIFASNNLNFAKKARDEGMKLRQQINLYR